MSRSRTNPLRYQPVASTPQSWVPGGQLYFKGFIPKTDKGGRVIIDHFSVVVVSTDHTVATADIPGEDMYRLCGELSVEQIDGQRRYDGIAGEELRIINWHHLGADGMNEIADEAVASNATGSWEIPVLMSKPNVKRPEDFALPADTFKQLTFRCGTDADIGVGSGTFTMAAATVYVVAHCFIEKSPKLYAQDAWRSTGFQTTEDIRISVGGRCQDAVLYKSGTTLASIANVSSVRVPTRGIMPQQLDFDPVLVNAYARSRGDVKNGSTQGGARTSNPFLAGKAYPVLWSDDATAPFHGDQVDDLAIETEHSSAVSDLVCLHRQTLPRSRRLEDLTARQYGVSQWRVNTLGKTKRNPGEWPNSLGGYMPLKGNVKIH